MIEEQKMQQEPGLVGDLRKSLNKVIDDEDFLEEAFGAFQFYREEIPNVPDEHKPKLEELYERAIRTVVERFDKECRGE